MMLRRLIEWLDSLLDKLIDSAVLTKDDDWII